MTSHVFSHEAVLRAEVLEALAVKSDGIYLDATFGRGGHAEAILSKLGHEGRLVCIDRDPAAVAHARTRLATDARVAIFEARFSELARCADQVEHGMHFDGALFDLGVSSPQLDDPRRGFSFSHDGPLDMRMSAEGLRAADVVNRASEPELAKIFFELGEERHARRIARAIVAARKAQPFKRTAQLAELITRTLPRSREHKHPATRAFQALRIHVNGELQELELGLSAACKRLRPHGRLAAISFHSLEDRIVKRFIRGRSQVDPVYAGLPEIPLHARATLKRIGGAVAPGEAELESNPRARSARLRVAEKLAPAEPR